MQRLILGRNIQRRRVAVLPAALLAGCLLSLAACGEGKSEEDVEAMLDKAFGQSVRSADVKLDAELDIEGLQGFERPIRIEASGPYIAGEQELPQLDLDLTVGAQDAGSPVQSGFLSTGDRAFVKFGGEFYEQPREDVERTNRELRSGEGSRQAGALGDLGLDPRNWVVDARGEEDTEVAGAKVEHVSGKLDTSALLGDLNKVVERSAGAVGGARPGTPAPLTAGDIKRIEDIVEDPAFDVYVGKEDGVIRRLSASIEVTVPEAEQAGIGGISGGSLRFSLELGDVNGTQQVDAPARARPIADLTEQLGGLAALGAGALGTDPGTRTSPGPGAEGAEPDVTEFERYSDCLDQASPEDTDALGRCASLLR